jgi:flagellar biosynthesis protein FliQ
MENQVLIVFICLIVGLVYGIKRAKSEISTKKKFLNIFLYPFAAYMLASLVVGLFLPPE